MGGFGNDTEQDLANARGDVTDGCLTVEAAQKKYGVVLRQDFTIDTDAIAALH